MNFEKIVTPGLASNSYFIAGASQAAVIDPRRDIDVYLHLAKKYSVQISTIFDTHRNEDFVNGSVELSKATDAKIYHGKALDFKYGNSIKENDEIIVNDMIFSILETPGHTPESISVVVKMKDHKENPIMVFTGDALFAGDVGRIDFYRDKKEQAKAAKILYDSIFNKLLKLPDSTVVYPAHGAGSVCGGNITGLPFTTIGYEKKTNPRLNMSKEDFLDLKSKERFDIAPYMSKMEEYNLEGAPLLNGLPKPKSLTIKELKEYQQKDVQIIDTRKPASFAGAHIHNTLHIWKNGLPVYAGWFLDYEKPIIIIKDKHQDIEKIVRYLIRLGYDNIHGYLETFSKWYVTGNNFQEFDTWSVEQLQENLDNKDLFILDVRPEHKVEVEGKIPNSTNIFVGHLKKHLKKVPKDKKICVYCDGGFKASIALSILQQNGYNNILNVLGGTHGWMNKGYDLEKV
ncbi:MAG: MBL fold metallo-hydrolase [Asgard group archaeon]|nr:MBL fold metallo-hydrolase [Asgard group archaeon]